MKSPTFSSKFGKVEIKLPNFEGLLFWITWEEVEVINIRFRIAGDAYEWQSSSRPLPTEAENRELIIQTLQNPPKHHRLSDTFTWWRDTTVEQEVVDALVLALSQLEIPTPEDSVFNPDLGKVKIEVEGINVTLFWLTFREDVFQIFLIASGDARIWRMSEWLHSAREKRGFIIKTLSATDRGPHSLRQFFFWRPPNTDNRILEALLKKVQALEIQEV